MKLRFTETNQGGLHIHMVGIKGVGMTALAEILVQKGAHLTGSDTKEKFFTDEILASIGVPVTEEFSEDSITSELDLVIYSAAYSTQTNPELIEAERLSIPVLSYPEALGQLSSLQFSAGVCGVHGKTTTTAMAGVCMEAAGIPAMVLVGSAVPDFGNRATRFLGGKYFVAETCEYRRHFLHFCPRVLVCTSVETDHVDYFKDYADIRDAFVEYAMLLPENGKFIYCADDDGSLSVARILEKKRPDIKQIPYGFSARGKFAIVGSRMENGKNVFMLEGFETKFSISLPGSHMVLDAAAAIALTWILAEEEGKNLDSAMAQAIAARLECFKSTRRRYEIIGEAGGILFMDDYAHHPTAIRKTLDGIREFYPDRRIIVDFMSHTYSRTRYMLTDFAASFEKADLVILHKIYASAREKNDYEICGEDLFRETSAVHHSVKFFKEVMDAEGYCEKELKAGDLFITMGAGDNWKLSHELFSYFKRSGK
ncbi:MAG: UDP-N-acetylmuramate--L-alanine ligase [Spirochaetaceae bacterium]|nr:MAG: UDP-N-acetylmuramate--L-alanine ligase [Spirochaetaceae bacterium]